MQRQCKRIHKATFEFNNSDSTRARICYLIRSAAFAHPTSVMPFLTSSLGCPAVSSPVEHTTAIKGRTKTPRRFPQILWCVPINCTYKYLNSFYRTPVFLQKQHWELSMMNYSQEYPISTLSSLESIRHS